MTLRLPVTPTKANVKWSFTHFFGSAVTLSSQVLRQHCSKFGGCCRMLKKILMLISGSLLLASMQGAWPLQGNMVSDHWSIPKFRRHMILEVHSQTLLEPSPSNIEKDKYYAVDYDKNYYLGRTRSAPDERQFILLKFLHNLQQTGIKRFDWPRHDDIDHVHSTCVLWPCWVERYWPMRSSWSSGTGSCLPISFLEEEKTHCHG